MLVFCLFIAPHPNLLLLFSLPFTLQDRIPAGGVSPPVLLAQWAPPGPLPGGQSEVRWAVVAAPWKAGGGWDP